MDRNRWSADYGTAAQLAVGTLHAMRGVGAQNLTCRTRLTGRQHAERTRALLPVPLRLCKTIGRAHEIARRRTLAMCVSGMRRRVAQQIPPHFRRDRQWVTVGADTHRAATAHLSRLCDAVGAASVRTVDRKRRMTQIDVTGPLRAAMRARAAYGRVATARLGRSRCLI